MRDIIFFWEYIFFHDFIELFLVALIFYKYFL